MYREIVENISEQNELKNNRLASLTKLEELNKPKWNRVGYEYKKDNSFEEFKNSEVKKDDNTIVKSILSTFSDNKIEEEYGIDPYFVRLNKTLYNGGFFIESNGAKGEVYIKNELKNSDLNDKNVILVKEDEELNIIIDYTSTEEEGFRNSLYEVIAEENSKVNLVYLQRLGQNIESFSSTVVKAKRNATVNQHYIDLGGKVVGLSNKVYLDEDTAKTENYSIYICDRDKKVDIDQSVYHRGRRCESIIEGRGVVKDAGKKVFRGNLYFERGSTKSVGKEEEFAILLNKGIKADSIPTLFCDEDDVIGEHAASAGQLDENKLFYLMSRGLSEQEAKKLVVVSAFRPIIEKIFHSEIREEINEEIEKSIF